MGPAEYRSRAEAAIEAGDLLEALTLATLAGAAATENLVETVQAAREDLGGISRLIEQQVVGR